MDNIYKPELVEIKDIIEETPDIRTFRLQFKNPELQNNFTFKAGQFAEYSVFGEGECTFCIASSPTRPDYLECSFKLAGKVTSAMTKLNVGDTLGLRGPYGNSFPLDGFQVQPDCSTVQGTLTAALSRLLGEAVHLSAASRTDAGVHASGQVITFTTENVIPVERIVGALNGLLPPDVAAVSADEVPDDFHARFQARRKQYVYRILNRPLPSPFIGRYAWHVSLPLDLGAMQAGAAHLLGEHDFAAFCAAGGAAKTTVRELYELDVSRPDELVEFTVWGSGFLYMMVRNLVGTLVEVGLGRMRPERVQEILASRNRNLAGPTAPAHGLTLVKVEY